MDIEQIVMLPTKTINRRVLASSLGSFEGIAIDIPPPRKTD